MRVYLSGPISGHIEDADYRFSNAMLDIARRFEQKSECINPLIVGKAAAIYADLSHEEYMKISYALMDICDAVFFMDGWKNSKGCQLERKYAEGKGMMIVE